MQYLCMYTYIISLSPVYITGTGIIIQDMRLLIVNFVENLFTVMHLLLGVLKLIIIIRAIINIMLDMIKLLQEL